MAKKSLILKLKKTLKIFEQRKKEKNKLRIELEKIKFLLNSLDSTSSENSENFSDEKNQAQIFRKKIYENFQKLKKFPRTSSMSYFKKRCEITGRSKGLYHLKLFRFARTSIYLLLKQGIINGFHLKN